MENEVIPAQANCNIFRNVYLVVPLRLDYKVLMRHEHINTALEITGIVRYFFRQVRIKRFPLPMHHLSFYNYLEASDCNTKRCTSFLAR